ncbi:hypothetical protein STAS_09137 [Striga asiatica]|uniref:Uncharacterized protein n=1 Tax=Striga asiatica TaxID=4170 RepID=A0A5A7PK84_STRAF|nr:hypothetical protein STAS_09134 [Striga asiatica]GER33025.1 hypothetical protein STAS_09137 [Striga asiatica]
MRNKISNFHTIHLFFILFLQLSCPTKCLDPNFDQSLDATFHEQAFKSMINHHRVTGALYNTTLPKDLSGMKVSVVRLRTRTLYKSGATFSHFIIPPKTRPAARVKRVLIVYHELGNWSSSYYNIYGYSFISPVMGFLVYDASNFSGGGNFSTVGLNNTWGKPVRVEFDNLTAVENQTRFCAFFGVSGKMSLTRMGSREDVCFGKDEGHFSVVVPIERQEKRDGPFWVMGLVAGIIGLVAVGLAGTVALGTFVKNRNRAVVKESDDQGECLESNWIGDSKMARAKATRTEPVLESTAPPSPRMSWYAK